MKWCMWAYRRYQLQGSNEQGEQALLGSVCEGDGCNYSYIKMKLMALMLILRHIFPLMYLIIICLCAFGKVGSIFVFYGREYLTF